MNKQPFYHRIDGLMFTSTTGFDEKQFLEAFEAFINSKSGKQFDIVPYTVEIEPDGYAEPEAGDPSDLM